MDSNDMDMIALRGMVFFGRHGANPEETTLGQRFGIDVSLWVDLTRAGQSDDLEDTVSYSQVYKLVRAEVEGEPSKLLEHLAGRILRVVLEYDTRISKVRVTVSKLSPPLRGSVTGDVVVVMERNRAWLGRNE